jgi:hypothetical protein
LAEDRQKKKHCWSWIYCHLWRGTLDPHQKEAVGILLLHSVGQSLWSPCHVYTKVKLTFFKIGKNNNITEYLKYMYVYTYENEECWDDTIEYQHETKPGMVNKISEEKEKEKHEQKLVCLTHRDQQIKYINTLDDVQVDL